MTEYERYKDKWKKKIGFDSLVFPIYKKSVACHGELYCFLSVNKVICVKTKIFSTINIYDAVSEALFLELYIHKDPCTAEEFNEVFEKIKAEINNLKIIPA